MKFSWNRVLNVIFTIILIAGILAGLYFAASSRAAKVTFSSLASNNHEDYLSCAELPFYTQAQKILGQHPDTVEQLKKAGAFSVTAEKKICANFDGGIAFVKGDILIQYSTHRQRLAIEKILGKTFFGISYRGENY